MGKNIVDARQKNSENAQDAHEAIRPTNIKIHQKRLSLI